MTETLRLAFLSSYHPRESARGAGHTIAEVGRRLARAGHDVDVYYPVRAGPVPPIDLTDGMRAIPVAGAIAVPFPFGPDLAYAWRVGRLLPGDRDVIVAHNEIGGAFVLRDAQWTRRRRSAREPIAIQTFHGIALRFLQISRPRRPDGLRPQLGYLPDWFAVRALEGRAARSADACVVCSRAIGEEVRNLYGIPARRIRVIYNGVEAQPAPTEAERSEARDALGLDPETRALCFIGEDTHRKGLDVAESTVHRLRALGDKVVLFNLGNPAPSSDGVRSLGIVDVATKRRVLVASDLFLLPTRYEGLPAVVQEAAALRLPVATTPAANIEWGTAGRDFVLIEPNTPDAAVDVIRPLLGAPERRRALAENGFRELGSRGYDQQASEYLALFRELLVDGRG